MEHDPFILFQKICITEPDKLRTLYSYAEMIYNENRKFNLTGNKSLIEIIDNLIVGSLEPLTCMNVPRGTFFADLGTGAGIPGIPVAVKYPEISGILFDSNQKKIDFIDRVAGILKIKNIKAINIRIEDAGRSPEFREKFDLIITRAMSDIYTISELGAPLLKKGGYIYAYTKINREEITDYVYNHISRLGLAVRKDSDVKLLREGTCAEGILIEKVNSTDEKFPRRMAVIKRMAGKNEM